MASESAEELASRQRVESYLLGMASEVSSLSWDEWRRACARREMEWCRQATISQKTGVKANALRWDRLVDDGILERADGGSRRVYYRISPAHLRYLAKDEAGRSFVQPATLPQTSSTSPSIPGPSVNEPPRVLEQPSAANRRAAPFPAAARSFPELCLSAREHVGSVHGLNVAELRVDISQSSAGVVLVVHRRSGRQFRVTQSPEGATVAPKKANAETH